MAVSLSGCIIVISSLIIGASSKVCRVSNGLFRRYSYEHCPGGCCGTQPSNVCCPHTTTPPMMDEGMSTSGLLASMFGVIAIIVAALCFLGCVCWCVRASRRNQDRVVRSGQPQVNIPTGATNSGYSPPAYVHPGPAFPAHQPMGAHDQQPKDNPPTYDECVQPPSYDDVIKDTPPV